ncbi:anaerobic dehydrogenase [Bacillus anthracis]|nr:anaerobic dehydrogenase [Bacillus anthracis]GAO65341.1 anaerobic dehydrogenase [Bacillus anthracis]
MIIKLVMLCIGIHNKVNIHTTIFKTMHVVAADAEVVVDAVADVAADAVVVQVVAADA